MAATGWLLDRYSRRGVFETGSRLLGSALVVLCVGLMRPKLCMLAGESGGEIAGGCLVAVFTVELLEASPLIVTR